MERKVNIAKKMSNIIFYIIARSCNKLVAGKTYWKNIVLLCSAGVDRQCRGRLVEKSLGYLAMSRKLNMEASTWGSQSQICSPGITEKGAGLLHIWGKRYKKQIQLPM